LALLLSTFCSPADDEWAKVANGKADHDQQGPNPQSRDDKIHP
jgi:hypothetical protein